MQDSVGRKGKGKGRDRGSISSHPLMRRSSIPPPLPGGLLNFARFETSNIDGLIEFLQELISSSAKANRVSEERMKSNVKVMATGGGAHMYYDRLKRDLGVEVLREEEMECLILGLGFIAHVPEEVFWFSEELVYKVSHPHEPRTIPASELPRPSPSPPSYQVTFAPTPNNIGETVPVFPCLVVNIGSGVSIVKVDENGEFERVSGTSLGGGTLWGLLSMLTDARTFDGEYPRSWIHSVDANNQKCLHFPRRATTLVSICLSEIFTGQTPARLDLSHRRSHPHLERSFANPPLGPKGRKCSSKRILREVCSTPLVTTLVMSRESMSAVSGIRLILKVHECCKVWTRPRLLWWLLYPRQVIPSKNSLYSLISSRSRCNHLHAIVCHPLLVQGDYASPFPPTRRFLVS